MTALRLALVGAPNSGKSTLFNGLTGGRAKVANYPGVTVERRVGQFTTPAGRSIELIDLPGIYGLAARSRDAEIADPCAGRADGGRGAAGCDAGPGRGGHPAHPSSFRAGTGEPRPADGAGAQHDRPCGARRGQDRHRGAGAAARHSGRGLPGDALGRPRRASRPARQGAGTDRAGQRPGAADPAAGYEVASARGALDRQGSDRFRAALEQGDAGGRLGRAPSPGWAADPRGPAYSWFSRRSMPGRACRWMRSTAASPRSKAWSRPSCRRAGSPA